MVSKDGPIINMQESFVVPAFVNSIKSKNADSSYIYHIPMTMNLIIHTTN